MSQRFSALLYGLGQLRSAGPAGTNGAAEIYFEYNFRVRQRALSLVGEKFAFSVIPTTAFELLFALL
jgi:hypothetical protein